MALSAEDAAYIVDQFGIDVERPLITQVSRFDPWKDPLGRDRGLAARPRAASDRAARARGLDGARRPRGLGLLQPDRRGGRRGPGHLHPLEPEQRRIGRGERVPGALRAPCSRSPSGRASGSPSPRRSGRRARSSRAAWAGSSTRSRTARPASSSIRSRSARPRLLGSSTTPSAAREMARRGKEYVRGHFLTPRLLRDWLALFNLLDGREPSRRRELVVAGSRASAARGYGAAMCARQKLIVVSNRGPVTFARDGRRARRSARRRRARHRALRASSPTTTSRGSRAR